MEQRPRISSQVPGHFLLIFAVPAAAILVAICQMSMALGGTLTPWKGGGFGMFASLDTPPNRKIVVWARDRNDLEYRVTVPFGRWPGFPSRAFAAQLEAMPTDAQLRVLARAVLSGSRNDLVGYRERAPHAMRNHPTDEHLIPLFVALGAGDPGAAPQRLHTSISSGVISMDAYRFD